MASTFDQDLVLGEVHHQLQYAGNMLCMHPANERRRYIVTSPLIGWVHAQNDLWIWMLYMGEDMAIHNNFKAPLLIKKNSQGYQIQMGF